MKGGASLAHYKASLTARGLVGGYVRKPLLPLDANGKPVKAAPAGDFVLEPDPADTDAAAPEADKAAEPAPEKAEQGDVDRGNRTQDNDENEQRKQ